MQNGIPTSSARRYRRPIAPAASHWQFHRTLNLSKSSRAAETSTSLFFNRGNTATLMGAIFGSNFSRLRFSPATSSSAYAEQIKARINRSTPSDGSMQCGMYFSLVCSSKYSRSETEKHDRKRKISSEHSSRCYRRAQGLSAALLALFTFSHYDTHTTGCCAAHNNNNSYYYLLLPDPSACCVRS